MVKSVQAHLVSIKQSLTEKWLLVSLMKIQQLKLLNDGANIKVVYPKEGTVFLPASAAIVKKAKNMEMPRNLSILLSLKKYKIHLVQPLLTVLFVKMLKQAKI